MSVTVEDRRRGAELNAFAGDVPLVAVMRGDFVSSLHRGAIAVVDAEGSPVLSAGNPREPAFLRSAAKPFQIFPAILSGGIDRFGITEPELAVLCASHNAEPRHMDAVLSVLSKIGEPESALHCGVHPPIHDQTASSRLRQGLEPTPVCNNCSGAHAGMLVACKAMGWPLETYERPDHPLQIAIRETLGSFTEMDAGAISFAVDNCAVPTFVLPLDRAALAFARLATRLGLPRDLSAAAERVVRAMTAFPEMVGGEHRFDSDVMRIARGKIVAKGGAEGFQGMGLPREGLGVALKISDGNSRAAAPVSMKVLQRLGILGDSDATELAQYASPEVFNHQNELVGRMVTILDLEGEA